MFGVGRRFVAICLTCGVISLARLSSASNVAPGKPTDLRVASVRDLTITLKWKRPLTTAGTPDSSVRSYEVSYKAFGSNSLSRLPVRTESAELGLQENKQYYIYVKAVGPNQSTLSDLFTVNTNDLVPAKPINLRVSSVNRLKITVIWNSPPVTKTGIADTSTLNYYVTYKNLESNKSRQIQRSTEKASLDLKANTRYEIKVRGCKVFNTRVAGRWSDALKLKTNESVPTKPPSNVKVVYGTLSSIKVSWGPIPENGRNGIILGYVVFYGEKGTPTSRLSERDVNLDYSQELTGLTSGKSYSVSVAGYTKMGRGTKSIFKNIIVGGQFITTTRKVTTQKPTTVVSEKPHSTSTKASRTVSVQTVGTIGTASTEGLHNTTDVFSTDPDAKTSTHSPGETAITPSSVPLVSPVPDDHSDQSTPAVGSVDRADEGSKGNSLKRILLIGAPVAGVLLLLIILIVFIGRSRKRKQLQQNGEIPLKIMKPKRQRKRSKDVVTRGAFSVRYEAPSGNSTLDGDSMTEGLLQTADEPDQPVIVVQEANGSLPRAEAEDVPLLTAGNSNRCDHLRVGLSAEQKQLEEGRASGLYESIGSLGKAGSSNEAKPDEAKSDDEERYVTQEQIDATRDKAQSLAQADYKTPNGHYKTPKAEVHYKTPKTEVAKDVPDYQNLVDKEHLYETLGLKDPEDPAYENARALPDNADRGGENESSPI